MNETSSPPAPTRSGEALALLYRSLPARRRRQVWATVALMLVGAVAEVISVGSILPFLAVLTNPERLDDLPIIGDLVGRLEPGTDLVAVTAMAFITLFLISGLIRLVLTWASQALAFGISHDLSVVAFSKLIRQPYTYYVEHHTGEAISRFEKLHQMTFTTLVAGVQALIASVIAVLLIALLLLIDPKVALISAALLVGIYLVISLAVKGLLKRNSEVGSHHSTLRIKRVQEALGGIRDILLDRSQPVFDREFGHSARIFSRVSTVNSFVSQSPRILIEMIGMVMIGGYAWYLAGQPGGVVSAIPMLGAFALGAQRLLPLLQLSYVGWSSFASSHRNVLEVAELLAMSDRHSASAQKTPHGFRDSLTFEKVSFAYPTGGMVLKEIDLSIRRGERIGIAGTTGSGKSTLMDLLLGLLEPGQGRILVDGQPLDDRSRAAWQAEIAHVPQAIYLLDDTLAANIAFGIPEGERDQERIERAAKQAGLGDFIAGLEHGFDTRTGERGVRLSGGQRQRIGIARALYKEATVLVLDEATSALDTRTEEGVMASISALGDDLTIIMIAHRLSTLEGCDRVIHLERGRIVRIDARTPVEASSS